MAFPQVRSTTSSEQNLDQTNQPHTLAGTINAGDLIVEIIALDSNTSLSWPAGWTNIAGLTGSPSSAMGVHARYKIADGTEDGTTITPVAGGAQKSTGICLVFFDYSGIPEAAGANSGGGSGPNPPSLSPSWGAADTLWVAGFGRDDGRGSAVAYPANYGSGQIFRAEGTAGGTALQLARRSLNAASEDPGAFGSVSNPNRAFTMAIQPVGVPPGGGGGGRSQILVIG
jgi:hypothetical protein